MSWPFSGWRTFSPISFVGFRSRAAVHALFAAIRIEEMGAPSIRAKAMSSPCGSATATTTDFCLCAAFSTIRSTILLASEYSMTGTFLMRIGGDLGEWRHQHDFGLLLRENSLESRKSGWAKCPARLISYNLEHKLQRKLNQTRVAVRIRGRHLSKAVGVSGNKIGAGEAPLRVIEQVEELGAELEVKPFSDRGFLENGEIKVVNALSAKACVDARFSSESPIRWSSEAIYVEPLI